MPQTTQINGDRAELKKAIRAAFPSAQIKHDTDDGVRWVSKYLVLQAVPVEDQRWHVRVRTPYRWPILLTLIAAAVVFSPTIIVPIVCVGAALWVEIYTARQVRDGLAVLADREG